MITNKLRPKSKIRQGSLMHNIVITMCEKFHNDRLRNNRALGNWKSDNNNPTNKHNNKNNVGSAWGPVSESKNITR